LENINRREIMIGMSMCDFRYRLGVTQAAGLFMDAATEHGELLGVGLDRIAERGYFWLAARAKYRFYRMPRALETVEITTWPAKVRFGVVNRYYVMKSGEELLAEGRTEWAVFNRKLGKIDMNPDEIFTTMPYRTETVCDGRMARINRDFTEAVKLGTYKVSSADIDVGNHMDNINYIRAILSMYSTKELEKMEIRDVEINYISQSLEGEELTIMRRETPEGTQYGVLHEDGTAAATAYMKTAE